jgi:hypothetical protein
MKEIGIMEIDDVQAISQHRFSFKIIESGQSFTCTEMDIFTFQFMNNEVNTSEEFQWKLENDDEYELYETINSMFKYYAGRKDNPFIKIYTTDNPPPPDNPPHATSGDGITSDPVTEKNILNSFKIEDQMQEIKNQLDALSLDAENLLEQTQRLAKLTQKYIDLTSLALDGEPTIHNLIKTHIITRKQGQTGKKVNCSERWLELKLNTKQIRRLMVEEIIQINSTNGRHAKQFTLQRHKVFQGCE